MTDTDDEVLLYKHHKKQLTSLKGKYEINPSVDFEKVDRDHLADMIYDYLVDNYGEVTSFDMKITGFYETAKYEFKRRK